MHSFFSPKFFYPPVACLFIIFPTQSLHARNGRISPHAQNPGFNRIQGLVDARLPHKVRKEALQRLSLENLPLVQDIFRHNGIDPWFQIEPPREIDGLFIPPGLKLDEYGWAHRDSRVHFKNLFHRLEAVLPNPHTLPLLIFEARFEGLAAWAARVNFISDVGAWEGAAMMPRPAVLIAEPGYASPQLIAHELGHLMGLEHHTHRYNLMTQNSWSSRLNRKQTNQMRGWLKFHNLLPKEG